MGDTHIYLFGATYLFGAAATTCSDHAAVTGADAGGFPSGAGADPAARSVLREPVLLLHLSVGPHQRDHFSEIHLMRGKSRHTTASGLQPHACCRQGVDATNSYASSTVSYPHNNSATLLTGGMTNVVPNLPKCFGSAKSNLPMAEYIV